MKKYIVSVVLVVFCSSGFAQSDRNEISPITNVHHFAGVAAIETIDPYLSLLNYTGFGVRLEHWASRYFNPGHPVLSWTSRLTGVVAQSQNPASTAGVIQIKGNYAWGVQYHHRWFEDLHVLAGGNADVDFGYKMNSRNVNNPYSLDLAIDLNLVLGVKYLVTTNKRKIGLSATIDFPVVGSMFVPYPGLSYYEMYATNTYFKYIYASSLHNKQGLKQYFTIDIPLKETTLSLGVRGEQLKYLAEEYVYNYSEYAFVLGLTFDVMRFGGKKSMLNDRYLSPVNY